jgi:hypothetical protein
VPIRPELRALYRGPAWAATRARILKRAKNRCEQCRKRNGTRVFTYTCQAAGRRRMFWLSQRSRIWRDERGRPAAASIVYAMAKGLPRKIRVVLTVAHLNHVAGEDRDENLKALCQWCHLNYDKLHHKDTRCQRKDAARPLLSNNTAIAI